MYFRAGPVELGGSSILAGLVQDIGFDFGAMDTMRCDGCCSLLSRGRATTAPIVLRHGYTTSEWERGLGEKRYSAFQSLGACDSQRCSFIVSSRRRLSPELAGMRPF
jgi:hypothetical protein